MMLSVSKPNIACICGVVLWDWQDVTTHWLRHRMERERLAEMQRLYRDASSSGVPRSPATPDPKGSDASAGNTHSST